MESRRRGSEKILLLDRLAWTATDGVNAHAYCSWCLYEGLIDSQGKFHPDGTTHCVIMRSLWPSAMKENSLMYRNDFMPEWLFKKRFYAKGRFLSGFFTMDKALDFIKQCEETYENWFINHPLQKPKWWEIWKLSL